MYAQSGQAEDKIDADKTKKSYYSHTPNYVFDFHNISRREEVFQITKMAALCQHCDIHRLI